MNKNKITIITIFILTAIASWLYYSNKAGTIKEELRDFAVKDTASITKIFLANATGQKVVLEKIEMGSWQVNGDFEARMDAIDVLLKTIYQLEVKTPVSKAAFDQVVKNIAGNSTKVEIYQGGKKPSKVYYVGSATADNFGTHMLLENSSTPFVVHVPGFYGYLTTRYFATASDWRSTNILKYNIDDLQTIEVNYFKKPEESFIIDNISSGELHVRSINNNKKLAGFDTTALVDYLMHYQNINFEFLVNDMEPSKKDSIITHYQKFHIKVTDSYGKTKTIKAFNNPVPVGTLNMDGEPMIYDHDRMYALINNDKDLAVIQYFVFDKLTPPISHFAPEPIVKK